MEIESRLQAIENRNARVELDKAWEVSWTRRLSIALVTYLIAALWIHIIHDSVPLLKALIPTAGYLLSTLSLPVIKSWWSKKNSK